MGLKTIAAFAFAILMAACTMNRIVQLDTVRVETETATTSELTPNLSVQIFRDVAAQLNFVVHSPIYDDDNSVSYEADLEGRGSAEEQLLLFIQPNRIRFISRVTGKASDFPKARRAADLIRRALDRRHIPYKERFIKTIPFWESRTVPAQKGAGFFACLISKELRRGAWLDS